jgi:hypothetical protein
MTTEELVARIKSATTHEDLMAVDRLIRSQPGKMAPAVQQALLVRLEETTQRANAFLFDVREDLHQRREETLPEQ